MKKLNKIMAWTLSCLMMLAFAACSEDDLSTNQFQGGVHLNVFGPSPVMRGGSVHFYGSNLDKIKQVNIPGMGAVTNFDIVKSGVPSEIVVKLDKDTPEPGYVTLITNTDDEIKTTTLLTYVEGIEFDEAAPMTPASIQPGDVLTIKGDYLNLVKEVIFAENVFVTEFEAQSRYELKVRVPEEARTGKIILSDGAEIPNWIYSASALVVGTPVVSKVASPRGEAALQGTVTAKLGETITVTGDFMSLVAGIKTGDADGELGTFYFEDFEVSADGKSLSFVLPAEAVDGDVNLICRSGVEIPACKLVTVAPTNVVVNGNQPAKNGQTMTIAGNDLDVVVSVSFPNVDIPVEVQASANEISVVVPELAQEGEIVLNMANRKTVTAPYTLVKPTATEYSANPASAGSMLQITGTNLDLVATVQFTGAENAAACEVNEDGTVLNVTVPMDSQSGAVVLNLKNGSTVTIADIKIDEAVFCYVTEFPSAETEIKAGETFTVLAKNLDKLTAVEMNGVNCQYIITGEKLVIGVPDSTPASGKLKLISSNGQIEYSISIIPATEVSLKLFSGMTYLDWSEGMVTIPAAKFADVPAGAIMNITYNVDASSNAWTQLVMIGVGWTHDYKMSAESGYSFDRNYVPSDDPGVENYWGLSSYDNLQAHIVLDEANLAVLKEKGLAICGGNNNTTVTKVTVDYTISLEENIAPCIVTQGDQSVAWTFPSEMTWDDNGRFRILRNVAPISDMKLTAGKSVMNFYVVGTGQIQVNNPGWSPITMVEEWNDASERVMTLTLDQAIIDCFTGATSDGWSNTALILQGSGLIVKKITILP